MPTIEGEVKKITDFDFVADNEQRVTGRNAKVLENRPDGDVDLPIVSLLKESSIKEGEHVVIFVVGKGNGKYKQVA